MTGLKTPTLPSPATDYAKSLERAEKFSGLNAFISIDNKIDIASLPQGRLSGVTIALKDTIHATGMPNTAGTAALENFIPREDAPIVKRLKDAGGIIVGKTNMHELAYGITSNNAHFGAAKNPYDPSRFPGGSSGGSAAAVAARIVKAAIAGDTGGSIRIPAALCGVIGFRPSPGRYPGGGVTPISHTRDVVGPVALKMADITLLDSVLAAQAEVTEAAKIKSLRIGVVRDPFYLNLNPETARATERALETIRKAGATLVEMDLPAISELVEKTAMPVALYETMLDLPAYLREYNTNVDLARLAAGIESPDVRGLFDMLMKDDNGNGIPGGLIPTAVYQEAMDVHRPALIALFHEYFSAHQIDAIAFPTTILPASPIENCIETVAHNGEQVPTFATYIRNAEPASLAGLPGITLPIGLTNAGIPLAMELDAACGNDDHLLAIARAIEPLFDALPAPTMSAE
ncbi:MAG: indoleacetamide hydrolase [Gammaproteobacteria bacterium]